MFVAPLVSSSQFTAKIPAIKAKQRQTVLLKSNIQPWNEPDTHTKTGRRFTMGNMPPAHTATRPHWVCGLSSEHWEGELLYFCRCYMRKQKKKRFGFRRSDGGSSTNLWVFLDVLLGLVQRGLHLCVAGSVFRVGVLLLVSITTLIYRLTGTTPKKT